MKTIEIVIRVLGVILLISAVGMGYMIGKNKDNKKHDKVRPIFLIVVLIISVVLLSLTHILWEKIWWAEISKYQYTTTIYINTWWLNRETLHNNVFTQEFAGY